MTKNPFGSNAGFTYIAAIVMVVIVGIMAAQAAQSWTMKMRREREVELLFRGTQVRDALRRWYKIKVQPSGYVSANAATATPVQTPQNVQLQGPSPTDLKQLISGSTTAAKQHFLRPSNLIDPITGKDWGLVKDGAGKIVGVASTSEDVPLKQANFPFDLDPADFEGKKKYNEWQFICNHFPKPGGTGGGVTGLGGTSSPGTSNPFGNNPAGNTPTGNTPSGNPR